MNALFVLVPALLAADPVATAESERDDVPRTYVSLRAGATSHSTHPELCIEGAPIALLSLEACGTGAGFFHHDRGAELGHFRTKWTLTNWRTDFAHFQPRLHAGFAELQLGDDDPGFFFTSTGPRGVETAGPELGASIRGLRSLGGGFELIGELSFSGAYFPHAAQLVTPQPVIMPTTSLSLGVGF